MNAKELETQGAPQAAPEIGPDAMTQAEAAPEAQGLDSRHFGFEEAEEPYEAREAALLEELESWKDKAYRAAADAENTRRRAEREVSQARKYGAERLAQALLPAADNLARALDAVGTSPDAEASSDQQNLHTALLMTAKELDKALEQNSVQRIDPKGEPFDPELHQAMMQVESHEVPEGHVAQVLSQGFRLHERLLKAAYVAVSTGPGPQEAPEEPEAG